MHPAPLSPEHTRCPLCTEPGGRLVWSGAGWRLVYVEEPGADSQPAHAAFYRLICNRHVAEWSDLSDAERTQAMQYMVLIERAIYRHVQPDKVNLASLGNMVPHLHWHIVARFTWDSHFPHPIWGQAMRKPCPHAHQAVLHQLPALEADICQQLDNWCMHHAASS